MDLGAIAALGHVAPTAPPAPCRIAEKKRAAITGALANRGNIGLREKGRQGLGNGEQQYDRSFGFPYDS
jgi:hypothetical protein